MALAIVVSSWIIEYNLPDKSINVHKSNAYPKKGEEVILEDKSYKVKKIIFYPDRQTIKIKLKPNEKSKRTNNKKNRRSH